MSTLKTHARRLESASPALYQGLRAAYHHLRYFKGFARSRLMAARWGTPGPSVITVPLDRIRYGNFERDGRWRLPEWGAYHGAVRVEGGDWDLQRTPIHELAMYRAARELLVNGRDLRATDYYGGDAPSQDAITRGAWFRVYEQNHREKAERLRALHRSMRESGYRAQSELGTGKPLDEIRVRIGRSGEILFVNSLHRLVVAKILEVDRVPAVVTVRHAQWIRVRRQFHELARSRGGKLYGKLPHPDLEDVPYAHDSDERVGLIRPHLEGAAPVLALDLGADLGVFSHLLEGLGFETTAVERDLELARYLSLLRDIEGRSFDVLVGDIADPEVMDRICARPYSVVLALNVFHHFLKTEEAFTALRRLLAGLRMERMVFQAHSTGEPQMRGAFLDPEPDEFVRLLLDGSCLSQARPIGRASDGRRLFLLGR